MHHREGDFSQKTVACENRCGAKDDVGFGGTPAYGTLSRCAAVDTCLHHLRGRNGVGSQGPDFNFFSITGKTKPPSIRAAGVSDSLSESLSAAKFAATISQSPTFTADAREKCHRLFRSSSFAIRAEGLNLLKDLPNILELADFVT